MANHQYGKSRSPAGSRGPGRTAQTVPVSRRQAGSRGAGVVWTAPQPGTPGCMEPEVRRWSHPVEAGDSSPAPEPALHYIRCALSYQNQLLADIKAMLEQMASAPPEPADDAQP